MSWNLKRATQCSPSTVRDLSNCFQALDILSKQYPITEFFIKLTDTCLEEVQRMSEGQKRDENASQPSLKGSLRRRVTGAGLDADSMHQTKSIQLISHILLSASARGRVGKA